MAADQEYFVIQKKDDDTLPSLTPDENTVDRHYSFEPQPYGAAPFMFPERLSCWDRQLSEFEDEPLELGGFTLYSVYSYSLDAAVLDKIPLHQRLLFKMGDTLAAWFVCHQDIAEIFRGNGERGAKLVAIKDY